VLTKTKCELLFILLSYNSMNKGHETTTLKLAKSKGISANGLLLCSYDSCNR